MPELWGTSPSSEQRAQGMPGARRTHCLACKIKKTHARPTQVRRNHTALPAQWFYGLLRALPGVPGLLAPVVFRSPAFRPVGRNREIGRLDPSVGGSGPHGLTVRAAPHVLRPNTSIATRLTSGDEWPTRPPYRGGLASLNHKFCLSERDIFSQGALDSSGKTGGGFCSLPVLLAAGRSSETANRAWTS